MGLCGKFEKMLQHLKKGCLSALNLYAGLLCVCVCVYNTSILELVLNTLVLY